MVVREDEKKRARVSREKRKEGTRDGKREKSDTSKATLRTRVRWQWGSVDAVLFLRTRTPLHSLHISLLLFRSHAEAAREAAVIGRRRCSQVYRGEVTQRDHEEENDHEHSTHCQLTQQDSPTPSHTAEQHKKTEW
jgi:hypothetical protein